jgi:diadenosine tetraphosphate (Ap4A) HIT family hydrolase
MGNETLRKFGYPQTLICEYVHWCVLLRPAQVTLGSLILGAKGNETAFSQLPPPAFSELGVVIGHIEASLLAFRPWDKINYLMLMMVDPNVHFHVIPRYRKSQQFDALSFPDKGWPAAPDLASPVNLDEAMRNNLVAAIKANWVAKT